MTREEIFTGVCQCLAKVVEVEAGRVKESDRLLADLGADSLDLLHLIFELEQRFQIKISPGDIERRAKARLGGEPLEVDGIYTAAALAEFRRVMPEVPPEELPEGLTSADLPHRFRVSTMMNLVSRLLEEKEGGTL